MELESQKSTWNSSLWDSSSFIKDYCPTRFLHFPKFLLLHHLQSVLLLGFFFILRLISLRPLLFDFQSIRAMTSQVQTESVHNFIIKVGFFFFWDAFLSFFFLFFLVFEKNFTWVYDVLGFFFFALLGFYWVSLLCSAGFLLLLRSFSPLYGTWVLQTWFPRSFFLPYRNWIRVLRTWFSSLISTLYV